MKGSIWRDGFSSPCAVLTVLRDTMGQSDGIAVEKDVSEKPGWLRVDSHQPVSGTARIPVGFSRDCSRDSQEQRGPRHRRPRLRLRLRLQTQCFSVRPFRCSWRFMQTHRTDGSLAPSHSTMKTLIPVLGVMEDRSNLSLEPGNEHLRSLRK